MSIRNFRHEQALRFIAEYTQKNGYPPSRRDLQEFMGYKSPSSAQRVIEQMVEEGVITIADGVSRSIVIGSNMVERQQEMM